jgi:polyisoprenyl-phosphate glycosyltransferase
MTAMDSSASDVERPHDRQSPELSVVLPCHNEREVLAALVERLTAVLPRTVEDHEIIFVDDGSTDGTSEALDALCGREPAVRVLHLSRSFGQQAALSAGLDAASGDAVVLMDCDLQDPPELIESFVARWREGYQVVYAVRRRRKEGILKRSAYALFYRSLVLIADIEIPLDAGDFCLLDRQVADGLRALPERHRFLRGLRSWVGFRQIGIEYERQMRHAGQPKYTLRKLVRLALSGYVGFSTAPLRLASWLGFTASSLGLLLAVWAVFGRILGGTMPRGWASTLAVVLLLGGVQLVVLGVMGEYLGRMYDEVRARPAYIVSRRIGWSRGEGPGPAPAPPTLRG